MDWMQTVTELTNPMNARQAIVDIEVLDALDFELQCQSRYHALGEDGHAGAAAFLQSGPCAHTTGLRCAGHVNYVLAHRYHGRYCGACGLEFEFPSLRFTPIITDAS